MKWVLALLVATMVSFGIKTSAPGVDVNDAAEKDLVVSSTRNCLKVDNVVHTTIDIDSGGVGEKVITHSLGFVPISFIAISYGGAYRFEPYFGSYIGGVDLTIQAQATDTDITIRVTTAGGSPTTLDLYYWLSETDNAI